MSENRRNASHPPTSTENAVSPGKITHDTRGSAVWSWDIASTVLAKKSVAELLTSLNTPGLLSVDSETVQSEGWSGNPYNRTIR